ncbi:MAG: exodeoxyribonuclease V subunit alpha [Acidobacteriota bacterium]
MDPLPESLSLSEIDRHFADLLVGLEGTRRSELWLAAALASQVTQSGHVCLNLAACGERLRAAWPESPQTLMDPEQWAALLGGFSVVGRPGEFRPLVLDDSGRLYLHRYWDYERTVVEFLQERGGQQMAAINLPLLQSGLQRLFPQTQDELDWQRVAAFLAVTRRLCVIAGGPGTGKTTTVVKILALLLEQAAGSRFTAALAAPTGKAAARLQEAVKALRRELDCSEPIRQGLPEETTTVHRLLGMMPGQARARFNRENPLPYDVVVVDEASMIDFSLMARLVQAIPRQSRLILLGDKDQLASVDPGAVFGDICDPRGNDRFSESCLGALQAQAGVSLRDFSDTDNTVGLQDSIVVLRRSYRFGHRSGIGELSRLVNEGRSGDALQLLMEGGDGDVLWRDVPSFDRLGEALGRTILDRYLPGLRQDLLAEAFACFGRFRLLCALRKGPYGALRLNQIALQLLEDAGAVPPGRPRWFQGQPVLVTQNDYQLKLFNGDVGLVFPDGALPGGPLRVFFPFQDRFRGILPAQVPDHEQVFAMTVHKSQGSEFDDILLLLPDRMSPVLTRELIYTAVTRARKTVEVWGRRSVFEEAVACRTRRESGLSEALWGQR